MEIEFTIGKAIRLSDGEDLTRIYTGGLLQTAVAVAANLLEQGLTVRVISMHTVKPLDHEAVLSAARDTKAMATLEEHSTLGGLGDAVAEVLAEYSDRKIPFTRIGVDSGFAPEAGSQEYLRSMFGLSPGAVTERMLKLFGATNSR